MDPPSPLWSRTSVLGIFLSLSVLCSAHLPSGGDVQIFRLPSPRCVCCHMGVRYTIDRIRIFVIFFLKRAGGWYGETGDESSDMPIIITGLAEDDLRVSKSKFSVRGDGYIGWNFPRQNQ
ncbi:hypothetical protein B0O99DRAFT_328409 [Bisporella sp. PMI_857]|nr:hypothetical protein B0O99DRAFT_328409 [Bisporella sp. PMI_857]